MRVVIYVRVSSDDQADNGLSLTTQLKECETYAGKHGMRVVCVFQEDYPGRFIDRPEFNKLRELIRAGEVDALIVYSLDRYTREPAHLDMLLDELIEHGVELHTAQGQQDIDSPEGRMFLGIQVQFGRFWWQKIREASMRSRNAIKTAGLFYGNSAPYGYHVVGSKLNYQLEIYEPEAEMVRAIYRMYDQGYGSQIIARTLQEQGYKAPRGTKWHPPAIVHILRNTSYKGDYAYRFKVERGKRITLPKDQWTIAQCPAIVSPELWERVNMHMTQTGKRFVRKHFFLLSGRITCSCGYAMTAYPNSSRTTKGHYGCNGRKVVKNGCQMPYLPIAEVDATFWEWVVELLTDPQSKLDALEEAQQEQAAELEPLIAELARIETAQTKLKNRLHGYEEMCADGDISRTVFKEYKAEIEGQLSVLAKDAVAIEEKIIAIKAPDDLRERLMSLFHALEERPEIFHDLTIHERRDILVDLDLYALVTIEEGKPVLYVQWYGYSERRNLTTRRTASST